jgi:shikimate dehydrogenase
MVTSHTKFLALIGFPIKHSLSPQIHNYIFKKYSIDALYGCFEVLNLKQATAGLLSLGFGGFNVTVPYKEKIIPYLDRIDKEAEIIGAVNTVKIEGRRLIGFNTDGKGFLSSLERFHFNPEGKQILILGAGGAAKAAGVYLAKQGAEKITFYDIIYSKAFNLARRLRNFFPKVQTVALKSKKELNLKNCHLLVNATGVGLKESDPLVCELKNFNQNLVVYDLIYNPPLTKLLKVAQKKGLVNINGLWMLIYQAIEAQKIWFGIDCTKYASQIYRNLTQRLK